MTDDKKIEGMKKLFDFLKKLYADMCDDSCFSPGSTDGIFLVGQMNIETKEFNEIMGYIDTARKEVAKEIIDYVDRHDRWKLPKGLTSLWLWRGDWDNRIKKVLCKKYLGEKK